MIIYSLRYDDGDGDKTEWFRNKAQAEKLKRKLTGTKSSQHHTYDDNISYTNVYDIEKHVIEPNKDSVVWFLNCKADTNNG